MWSQEKGVTVPEDNPCLTWHSTRSNQPISNTRSYIHRRANDFYGAPGMASNEFRYATEQETLDASLPMRTNHNQIGAPFCCGIDDALSDVTYLDGGTRLEPCSTQLLRNSLDQLTGQAFF